MSLNFQVKKEGFKNQEQSQRKSQQFCYKKHFVILSIDINANNEIEVLI